MENMAVAVVDFTAHRPEIIKTVYGDFDKEEFIDQCNSDLHTPKIIKLDPATLFHIYDVVDKEGSGDEAYDAFSGRVMYPVRIQVVKTLYNYLHDPDMFIFFRNKAHRSLDMAAKGRKEVMQHQVKQVDFDREVTCACEEPVCSNTLLLCEHCKTVLCPTCSKAPCAVLIKDMIMTCELQDEAYRNGGYRSASSDSDNEVSEEEEDEDIHFDDDDDMEFDDQEMDSDNEEEDSGYESMVD